MIMSELSHAAIPVNNHINIGTPPAPLRPPLHWSSPLLFTLCIIIDTVTKQAISTSSVELVSGLSVVLSQVREVRAYLSPMR